jgi:hypothetical protein
MFLIFLIELSYDHLLRIIQSNYDRLFENERRIYCHYCRRLSFILFYILGREGIPIMDSLSQLSLACFFNFIEREKKKTQEALYSITFIKLTASILVFDYYI